MGLGIDILLALALAFLVLGPTRMHSMLGQVVQTRAQLTEAIRNLPASIDAGTGETHTGFEAPGSHGQAAER